MAKSTSIYDQAVRISEEYLGPAGERFMRRQISTHLSIEPENLHQKDMYTLIDWASLAFALLTDDTAQVESFTENLLLLTTKPRSTKLHGSTR